MATVLEELIKEIEQWLSETTHRSMYSNVEVQDRLLDLRGRIAESQKENVEVREGV